MDENMDENYFQRYLDVQFKAVFARVDTMDKSIRIINEQLREISDAAKLDAATVSELKGRIVLISSLIGSAIAAAASGIFSYVFKGSK